MDKKTLKKQEIIRKSINVMFEHGYHGTGVKDLSDAAGIPKGSLYNYFENKEDYAKEALNYYYHEMSKKQFSVLSDSSIGPIERIKGFFSVMIDDLNNENALKMGCFVGKITQEMSGISQGLQEITEELHMEVIQKIKLNLEEAIDKKLIDSNKEPEALAEFIFSSWQGILLRVKCSNDKKTLDNFYKILVEVLLV